MPHRFVSRILLVLLAVLLSISKPVCAQQVLFASSTSLLGMMDFATLSKTGYVGYSKIGTLGEVIVGMGYAPDGQLYGLDASGNFYTINQTNAHSSKVGSAIAVSGGIVSAAWDGKNTLYVLDSGNLLQKVDLTDPFNHKTTSLGALQNTGTLPNWSSADGFMAVKNGTLYIGGQDSNFNNYIYKATIGASGVFLSNLTAGGLASGFQSVSAGANINNAVYGFGQDPNPPAGLGPRAIFTVDTSTGAGTLASYYKGFGLVDAAIVFSSVPEASSFVLLSLMLGGGGLLLRRKRGAA